VKTTFLIYLSQNLLQVAIDAVTSLDENTQQQNLPLQEIVGSDQKAFIC